MRSINSKIPREENVGSFWRMFFLPIDDLVSGLPNSIARPIDDVVDVSAIVPTKYDHWFTTEFILSTANFTYTEEYTANGVLYKHTISWAVAKDYNFRRIDFDDMEYHQFAVVLVDNNGKGYFFGHIDIKGDYNGMRFSKKKTLGDKVSDLNYYTLQFYMESNCQPFNAYYITSPIVDPVHNTGSIPLPGPGDGLPMG